MQRPVVSVWRTRSVGSDAPFPDPVRTSGAEPHFVADEVSAWLAATGRGNNPDAVADTAAFAAPAGLDLRDRVVFAGLTSLLCLKALSGRSLTALAPRVVLQLAQQTDAGDALLLTEVSALTTRLDVAAEYADLLAEAAYGPAAALHRLHDQRFRLGQTDLVSVALDGSAHALVTGAAQALARGCGGAVYVDPTDTGSDLLLAVARADASNQAEVVLQRDGASSRGLRRRLLADDLAVGVPRPLAELGPAVAIAHLPGGGDRAALLDEVDDLAVSLGDHQRGLVLAPASLLTDDPRDRQLSQLRSQILRTGKVRAIVRLPAGLVTSRPREALAVWVLGPEPDGLDAPSRPIALADLSDEATLIPVIVAQMIDDLLAAVSPRQLRRGHSWSRARLVLTSAVLAQTGSVFPARSLAAATTADGPTLVVRLEALRRGGPETVDVLAGAAVHPRDPQARPAITVGDAVRQRLIRVLQGSREGFETFLPDGSVPVLGVAELTGELPPGARRVDRLSYLGGGAGCMTDPGDVVFCTSPRPRAVVDVAGGSAVPYPARVLRVDPSAGEGLSAAMIAHVIHAQPSAARRWRDWLLPRLSDSTLVPATDALLAVEQEKHRLRARLAELDELQDLLARGLTDGVLDLSARPDHPQENH